MTSLVPVLIAALLAGAGPALDTVFLRNGGRVRGTVVEEDPGRGVSIQLPDGEVRKLLPAEVARVVYGEGSGAATAARPAPADPHRRDSTPGEPSDGQAGPTDFSPLPPPFPTQPAEPPRGSAPVEGDAQAAPEPTARVGAFTFAASLFRQFAVGDAQAGVAMEDFTSSMTGFGLEAGMRLDQHVVLGAFLEVAGGTPGPELEAECDFNGVSCSTNAGRLGVFGRYVLTPTHWHTPWFGLGIGLETLGTMPDDPDLDGPTYAGFELVRVSAGWDYRWSANFGVGLFATGTWSRYADFDSGGSGEYAAIQDRRGHSWLQLGLRAILLP